MKQQLRIAHVISSLKRGGAETVLYTLVRFLQKEGHTQIVYYFHDGPLRIALESLGIQTQRVSGFISHYDPVCFLYLLQYLRSYNPDIIHSSLWLANFLTSLAARLLSSIPVICSLHTVRHHEGRIRTLLNTISIPFTSKLIAVSHSVAQSFKQSKLYSNKLTIISNGLDCEVFNKQAQQRTITREQLGINKNSFVLGSVGRFVPVKNYDFLLAVFADFTRQVTESNLILVGTGPEYTSLQLQADKLGIAHKTVFIVDQPAQPYYKLFDCFVQPSHYEGLSIALLEALYSKIPCIVTSINKHHDIITHMSTGILVSPETTECIQALTTLYGDSNLRTTVGIHGHTLIADQYTAENMVRRYTALFKEFTWVSRREV